MFIHRAYHTQQVYDPSKIIQAGYFYVQLKLSIVVFQYKQNLPVIFTGSRKAQNTSVTNVKWVEKPKIVSSVFPLFFKNVMVENISSELNLCVSVFIVFL